jgi:hypothetical protein
MNAALADIAYRLKSAGRIAPDDVLAMRRAVYAAPQVAREDAEGLLALDAVGDTGSPEWAAFLGDVLVDYLVRQSDPEDFVDDAKADWLMQAASGPLKLAGGVDALVRVVEAAEGCPAALETFVLGKVKDAVIGERALDAAAVALLRRLVFAGGGEDNIGVTRAEADALFDVDHARGDDADASWPTFFAQAIDDHLTAVSPFQLESRDDARRDEAWLKSRPSLFDFFKSALHVPDFKGEVQDILDPYAAERNEWRDAGARMDADEAAAAAITDEEARWLIGRMREGRMTAAGAALVARLKGEAGDSAALKPLFDAA